MSACTGELPNLVSLGHGLGPTFMASEVLSGVGVHLAGLIIISKFTHVLKGVWSREGLDRVSHDVISCLIISCYFVLFLDTSDYVLVCLITCYNVLISLFVLTYSNSKCSLIRDTQKQA